jgi:DNA-binding MarR family transcriptional regulator
MPSKPNKGVNRNSLPDWAAEVTPNDEVMEKFYAPTGNFPSGPLKVLTASPSALSNPIASVISSELNQPSVQQPSLPTSKNHSTPESKRKIPTVASLPRGQNKSGSIDSAITSKPEINRSIESSSTHSFTIDFARKWGGYLYTGQLSIMRVLYSRTIAVGNNECITSYADLAAATNMTRRNCIRVVQSLVQKGFIEQLQTMNDSTHKGMRLSLHLEPL